MRRTAAASIALMVLFCPYPSHSQDGNVTPAAICDQTAASPFDQNRPANVVGVAMDKIDTKTAIPACEAAAKAAPNDPRTAFQLVCAYFAAKDYVRARRGLEQAAALGNADAMFNLGLLYNNGFGIAQDYATARAWYEKAAALENAQAMDGLGMLFAQGQGVTKNYGMAQTWFQKAAGLGDSSAMFHLGRFYHAGLGVVQDYATARAWYEKAAARGNTQAMNFLGSLYRDGLGVAQDYATAREWFERAAILGDVDAMTNLGTLYHSVGAYFTDRKDNDSAAQAYAEAVRWYRMAVEKGEGYAQNNLGVLYADGFGVPRDLDESERLISMAAKQGVPTAQSSLMWVQLMIKAKKAGIPNSPAAAALSVAMFAGVLAMTTANANALMTDRGRELQAQSEQENKAHGDRMVEQQARELQRAYEADRAARSLSTPESFTK